jgi:hypothetical protein
LFYLPSSAHRQPRLIGNIIGRDIHATTTAVIPIKYCATTKAAASTKQQRPRLQCNDNSRGIYEITTAAD